MASSDTPKTILLKGRPLSVEGIAGGAIKPGHLCSLASTGKYVVHPTAGAGHYPLFAREVEIAGNKDIDTAYADTHRFFAWHCLPGDEVYAFVPANAPAIVIGDKLESNGDGTLVKQVLLTDSSGGTANRTVQAVSNSYTEAEVENNFADLAAAANRAAPGIAVAIALEALDNSAVGAVARIKVRII